MMLFRAVFGDLHGENGCPQKVIAIPSNKMIQGITSKHFKTI
jgi:hypothetical protein